MGKLNGVAPGGVGPIVAPVTLPRSKVLREKAGQLTSNPRTTKQKARTGLEDLPSIAIDTRPHDGILPEQISKTQIGAAADYRYMPPLFYMVFALKYNKPWPGTKDQDVLFSVERMPNQHQRGMSWGFFVEAEAFQFLNTNRTMSLTYPDHAGVERTDLRNGLGISDAGIEKFSLSIEKFNREN